MKISVVILAVLAHVVSVKSAVSCDVAAVKAILPKGTTLLSAESYEQNSTFGRPSEIAYPKSTTQLPAFCALTVNATSSPTSSYRFGIFLPKNWNGRFLTVGNGGLAGGINWPSMGAHVKYGFAVVSTDVGHNSTSEDGRWALNNPEGIVDYSYRALHGTVLHAKDIIREFYGTPIEYSYFSGCSTGGRQGLLEMQRYPEDFDGVLVGAAPWKASTLDTWMIQTGMLNLPDTSDHHIPPKLFSMIEDEVYNQCDEVDGLRDGVISHPEACDFRPETMLCRKNETRKCLTGPQIGTLHNIYQHYVKDDYPNFFHPMELGGESSWGGILGGKEPLGIATTNLRNIVLNNRDWDWRDFNYSVVQHVKDLNVGEAGADNFNLSPFHQRGGKVIMYHGMADSFNPQRSSKLFYDEVYRNMTAQGVALDNFFRFFRVPGMLHCAKSARGQPWYIATSGQPEAIGPDTFGVPGFDDADHNALRSLMRWVEEGTAPASLTATKWVNDTVALGVQAQRKVCKYPIRERYVGGAFNRASSWECPSSNTAVHVTNSSLVTP